jgi:hypothetical protein
MGPKYLLKIKLTIPGKGDYSCLTIEPTEYAAYISAYWIVRKLYYNEIKMIIDPVIRNGKIKISDENQIGTYEIEEIQ